MGDEYPVTEWRRTNRDAWDERVPLHCASKSYDLDAVVRGLDKLRPWEDEELGSLEGLSVVHLQCHIGTDTVGLARRGARVVGLDFSEPALRVASELAQHCGLRIDWVCSDVYDAVSALGERTFDVVYTGIGALCWLPDLERWAAVVSELLRPGGTLYLTEIHPMAEALGGDGRNIREDAIGTEFTLWDDEEGSYAAPDASFENNATWSMIHPLSEVLSALLVTGLEIKLFHEFDVTPSPTPWLELGDDGLYRFPAGMLRFPLTYSIRATLPGPPSQ